MLTPLKQRPITAVRGPRKLIVPNRPRVEGAQELVVNGDFEDGRTGWSPIGFGGGDTGIVVRPAQFLPGTNVLAWTDEVETSCGVQQVVPVEPETQYSIGIGYYQAPNSSGQLRIQVTAASGTLYDVTATTWGTVVNGEDLITTGVGDVSLTIIVRTLRAGIKQTEIDNVSLSLPAAMVLPA